MSVSERTALWERLRAAALVEGDAPPSKAPQSPWFVRVMLGIAGWIGALFLLGFVGALLSGLFDSAAASLLLGAALCASALFLFRWSRNNDFLDQFAFAVSLAGQALIATGLEQWTRPLSWDARNEMALTAFLVAGVQVLLFSLATDFLHRVWTALTAALAIMIALASWNLLAYAPPLLLVVLLWIWLREVERPDLGAWLRPAGYGVTLTTLLAVFLLSLLGNEDWFTGKWEPWLQVLHSWLPPVLSGAIFLWMALRLLRREGVPIGSAPGRIALAGAGILAIATLWAPGLAPMIAIVIVGHANGNRLLTGLGILGLLGYLSSYYYSLEITLLQKSALLMAAGAVLLLVRLALHRWWPEETAHA
jgi:uncharacterized membrane protein